MTKVKCLVVDDFEDNLLVMQALLRRDDVELLLARSGAEALDLLLRHEVALAFVDVQMPEMDGFELAELMRSSERTRHIPLIFVTAGVRDQHRVFKGYDSGAVDFLYKPVEPTILKNKAEVFFQLHRQKQQIERELQERTEALRLNEMFAGVLGHDLRTPLGAILSGAHVLEASSSDPLVKEVAARVKSSGQRMSRMIADLLDMTLARQGNGIPLNREPANLDDIVRAVIDEHRGREGGAIEVIATGDPCGTWDRGRLTQVLANLVGNAIEHGRGAGPIAVEIDGTAPGEVSVAVSNDGEIDAGAGPHIFEPFRTRRTDHQRGGGLGLGLYIARQIVEAHGGRISVASTRPGRTTFRVLLPRSRD